MRELFFGAKIGVTIFIVFIALMLVLAWINSAHAQDNYYNDGNGYVTRYGQRYGDVESIYVPPPPPPIPPLPESPKSCLQTGGGCW